MRLLREAGRLDLLAEGVACRERPMWQAASGVAAAVAACSSPRSSGGRPAPQVRSPRREKVCAGRAGAPSRQGKKVVTRRPASFGARPLSVVERGGAGTGVVPAAAPKKKGVLAGGPRSLGARPPKRGLPAGCTGWGFDVLSLGAGAGGDRERAHDRRERLGRK
ncbi:hypothetical protein NDU88_003483 [Pleurodeles waltl]|uniref:Uncharacterized protein n=1 Tax=Pleurodeles waltl TaxID=8319 RepID=A0AAV7MQN9_PLEWA|nr:hypothetical protein NDU88_003483 [Pleurodeles waltl]